jgi:hypothetical protein
LQTFNSTVYQAITNKTSGVAFQGLDSFLRWEVQTANAQKANHAVGGTFRPITIDLDCASQSSANDSENFSKAA